MQHAPEMSQPDSGGAIGRGTSRSRHLSRPAVRELACFGGIYLLYDAARWIFVGHLATARAHAHALIHLERVLHIAVEGSVQRSLSGGVISWMLANIYLAAQLAVLPGALICLYRWAPQVYRPLRSTIALLWLASIPVFAAYPVAPPRLAGVGIRDTVSHQAAVALTGHSTIFYNPYAAMPSLHVGIAFAISVAVAAAVTRRVVKVLALLWGPAVTLAVIATGNHYVLDAAAGVLLTSVCFLCVHAVQHTKRPSRVLAAKRRSFINSPVPEGSPS